METIEQYVVRFFDLLGAFFELMIGLIRAANDRLALGLPAELISVIGVALAVLVLAGGVARLVLWRPRSFRPQQIILRTDRTPAQVVAADIRAFFGMLFRVFIALFIVWLVLRTRG